MRHLTRIFRVFPLTIVTLSAGNAAAPAGMVQINADEVIYPLALTQLNAAGERFVLVLLSRPKNCDGGITVKPVLRRAAPRGPLREDPTIREVRCRGLVVKYSYDLRSSEWPDFSEKGLLSAADQRPIISAIPAMALSFLSTADLANYQLYLSGEQGKPPGVIPIASRPSIPPPASRPGMATVGDLQKPKPVPKRGTEPRVAKPTAPPAPRVRRQSSGKPSAGDPTIFGLLIGDTMTDAKLQRAAAEASGCGSYVRQKDVTQRGGAIAHSFACPLGFGSFLGRVEVAFWLRDGKLDSIRRFFGGPVPAKGRWDCYGVEDMYEATRIVPMSKPWVLVRDGHWERPALLFGPVRERWRIDKWGNVYVHQFHNGWERNETCGVTVPEKTWVWTFDSGASGRPPGY